MLERTRLHRTPDPQGQATRGPRTLPDVLDWMWFSSTGRHLRHGLQAAADLMAPSWCVGCGAEGTDLCPECTDDLRLLTRRPVAAEAGADALPVIDVTDDDLRVLPVFAAGWYRTLVADVVVAFKEHERVGLRRVLAPALRRAMTTAADHLVPAGVPVVLLRPPPSLAAHVRRGRDPLDELLQGALPVEGFTRGDHLITRRPVTEVATAVVGGASQKTRGSAARRQAHEQLQLAAGAQAQLATTEVLLVDDVLTTGSTLRRLYELASAAGAHVCGAAVVAATPRGDTPGQR